MSRFFAALIAVFILVLVPTIVSAQDLPMPGRGEILELRRDDSRNAEGYRSFIFGSWTPGMGGFAGVLNSVNADLEGDRRVTMEQVENANPCIVIYHRADHRSGRNGSCDGNPTNARMTFADFCEGDRSCARWPMGHRVYRIPARPRLTPGERAEEMVNTLDQTTVTDTVPAPAELGNWMTELSDLMGEEQAPSYGQVRNVLAAVGRTLTRTPSTSTGSSAVTAPVPAATADVHAAERTPARHGILGTSPAVATSRPTSAEDGTDPTSSTSDGATTSILTNPKLLWFIIAILSIVLIFLLFKDKIISWYRPTKMVNIPEPPPTEIAPPAPTMEQVRDRKFFESLERLWKQYCKPVLLSEESLNKFFMDANINTVLATSYGKDLLARAELHPPVTRTEPQIVHEIEYREDTRRVSELEGMISEAVAARVIAEARATNAEASLVAVQGEFDKFRSDAKADLIMVPTTSEPLDESVPDLPRESTNLGMPPSEEPLPSEPTHSGLGTSKPSESDDVAFRVSQHAPAIGPRKGRKQIERDERRHRRQTEPIERPKDDRPVKDILIPGSLVQPPLPVIVPATDHGSEPDPTEDVTKVIRTGKD